MLLIRGLTALVRECTYIVITVHTREHARKAINAGAPHAKHLGGVRLAGSSRQPAPEGKEGGQSELAAASGAGFNFGGISVFSSERTRSSSTANRDDMIQADGPARFKSSCGCGHTCTKCRNPQGSSAGPEDITRSQATETRGPDSLTRNGDAPGGAAAPAAPAPVAGAAAPARSARLKSGPRYTPNGSLTPVVAADGRKSVAFDFDAVFDRDPAAGVFPGCGEIHQDIKWNAAAAASWTATRGVPTPHDGFPATHPANTWIEDRDDADTRYGRRSGAHSAPSGGDQYTTAGAQDMAHGATYHGHDGPDVAAVRTGRWTFMVLAFDMCNHGVQVGNADFITIDW